MVLSANWVHFEDSLGGYAIPFGSEHCLSAAKSAEVARLPAVKAIFPATKMMVKGPARPDGPGILMKEGNPTE